ncbi:MAG: outer membrane beta-barrel family protein, partial [Urechidicola sp.]|nr:outer membrane beta-barrel family protein [Urechidicola sp.]
LQLNMGVYSNSNNSSNFNGQQNIYKISKPDQTYERKQETLRDQKLANISSTFNVRYNEPLSDNHHLNFQVGTAYRIKEQDVHQTKHIDDVAQNPLIYELNYTNLDLNAGAVYKYDYDNKLVISGGVPFLHQTQDFGLLDDPTQYNNNYNNIMPQFSARYKPARGKLTMIRLKKAIILPSIIQISPAINDFNPLRIKQGNPYLTPQEVYSINGTMNRYYFTSGFSFISHLNYGLTDNAIVKSETTDEEGVQTVTYENYGDKKTLGFDVTFRKRIKPLGFRLNLSLDGRLSNYFTIINSELNETSTKTGSVRLSVENDKKNTVDATVGVYFNKNFTTFSSVQNVDRDFLQQTYYAKVDWNISDRFNLNSQFKYDIYTDSNFETAQRIPIWNATFVYTFKKSKLMNAKFTALDILNKNVGLVRTSSDNYFQEIQREVLGTYYMLSLTFNLNSTKRG